MCVCVDVGVLLDVGMLAGPTSAGRVEVDTVLWPLVVFTNGWLVLERTILLVTPIL